MPRTAQRAVIACNMYCVTWCELTAQLTMLTKLILHLCFGSLPRLKPPTDDSAVPPQASLVNTLRPSKCSGVLLILSIP